jgi:hypothetical protein
MILSLCFVEICWKALPFEERQSLAHIQPGKRNTVQPALNLRVEAQRAFASLLLVVRAVALLMAATCIRVEQSVGVSDYGVGWWERKLGVFA